MMVSGSEKPASEERLLLQLYFAKAVYRDGARDAVSRHADVDAGRRNHRERGAAAGIPVRGAIGTKLDGLRRRERHARIEQAERSVEIRPRVRIEILRRVRIGVGAAAVRLGIGGDRRGRGAKEFYRAIT